MKFRLPFSSSFSVLLILFVMTLSACKKQVDADEDRRVVPVSGALHKEYFHKQTDQLNVYSYNKAGKMLYYEYHFDEAVPYRTEQTYTDGKLHTVSYLKRNSLRQFYVDREYVFSYDEQGRLAEIAAFRSQEPFYWDAEVPYYVYPTRYVFTYPNETAARFDECVTHYRMSNRQSAPIFRDEVEYDAKGNLLRRTTFLLEGEGEVLYATYEYDYLDAKNPNYLLTFDQLENWAEYFSPNTFSRSHQTNAQGLTLQIVERDFTFDGQGRVTEFTESIEIAGPAYATKRRYFEYY